MRLLLTFIALSLVLTSCGHGDAKSQNQLTGTWVADFPSGVRSTWIIHADGSYFGQLTGFKSGRVVSLEGKVQLKNGFLLDTCTKHSDTNATVPFVIHGYIISMNDHEIISKWEGRNEFTTHRKVER